MTDDESLPVAPPAIPAPSEDPPTGKQEIESPEPFTAPFGRNDEGTPSEIALQSLVELSAEFEANVDKIEKLIAADEDGTGNLKAVIDASSVEELANLHLASGTSEGDGSRPAPGTEATVNESGSGVGTMVVSTLVSGLMLRLRRDPGHRR